MARLDRSPAARELAQVAAAIGREFRHDLLAAVAPVGEDGLRGSAGPADRRRARLPPRGAARGRATPSSTRWSGTPPTGACSGASAGSCTPASCRRWRSTSRARWRGSPNCSLTTVRGPGSPRRRRRTTTCAGQRAIARSAMAEAVSQLQAGLDALAGLPDGPGRRRHGTRPPAGPRHRADRRKGLRGAGDGPSPGPRAGAVPGGGRPASTLPRAERAGPVPQPAGRAARGARDRGGDAGAGATRQATPRC